MIVLCVIGAAVNACIAITNMIGIKHGSNIGKHNGGQHEIDKGM